jgi:hypothetical protein
MRGVTKSISWSARWFSPPDMNFAASLECTFSCWDETPGGTFADPPVVRLLRSHLRRRRRGGEKADTGAFSVRDQAYTALLVFCASHKIPKVSFEAFSDIHAACCQAKLFAGAATRSALSGRSDLLLNRAVHVPKAQVPSGCRAGC